MNGKLIALFVLVVHLTQAQPGAWTMTTMGLPVYNYTGKLPVMAVDKDGKDANLPEDPYFLLGNYRLSLLTHVSGTYLVLTAERAWARLNASSQTNYGWNDASIVFKNNGAGEKIALVGINSLAANPAVVQRTFGVGVARYTYQLSDQVGCTRTISVKPSPKINTGNPAFVVTVSLKNNGNKAQELVYTERMLVNFVLNGTQYTDKAKRPLLYTSTMAIDPKKQLVIADVAYKTNEFLVVPTPSERYSYDVDPPSAFMWAKNASSAYRTTVTAVNDTLVTTVNTTLKPGQTIQFNIVIGLTNGNGRIEKSGGRSVCRGKRYQSDGRFICPAVESQTARSVSRKKAKSLEGRCSGTPILSKHPPNTALITRKRLFHRGRFTAIISAIIFRIAIICRLHWLRVIPIQNWPNPFLGT